MLCQATSGIDPRFASPKNVTGQVPCRSWGIATESARCRAWRGRSACARREVVLAVVERYRAAGRSEKGRILDELCSVTGSHPKHATRVLSPSEKSVSAQQRQRHRTYGPSIQDALIALWEASDGYAASRSAKHNMPGCNLTTTALASVTSLVP
jgi:hypothetical protein